MKFLTVMVALAAAAAGAYYLFLKDSAPYAAYKSFASAIAMETKNARFVMRTRRKRSVNRAIG